MQFSCEACEARYLIPEERLGRAGVRVRCKKCGNVVRVRPPSAAELALVEGAAEQRNLALLPGRAPGDAPRGGAEWFVAGAGEASGPHPDGEVRRRLATGELPSSGLVWREGLVGWTPASAIPELAAPPAPPAAAARAPAPPPLPAPMRVESAAASALAELARRGGATLDPARPVAEAPRAAAARPTAPASPERRILYASLALAVLGAAALGAGAAWLAARPSPERGGAPTAAPSRGPGAAPPPASSAVVAAPAPAPAASSERPAASPPAPAAASRAEPGAPARHAAAEHRAAKPHAASSRVAERPAQANLPRKASVVERERGAKPSPATGERRPAAGEVPAAATAPAPAAAPASQRPEPPALPPASRPPRSEDELLAELGEGPKPPAAAAAAAPAAKPAPAPQPQPQPRARDPLLDSVSDDDLARELGTPAAAGPAKRSVYVPPAPASALPERLTPEQVNRAVAARTPDLKRCIADQRAAEPGLKGTLKIRLLIGGDGAVTEASPVTRELAGKPIARCIAGVVKDTRFPRSRAGQEVVFPFKF